MLTKRPRPKPRSFQHRLMHRIYNVLRDERVVVIFDDIKDNPKTPDRYGMPSNVFGIVLPGDSGTPTRIVIDHRYDVIATLVHECLHVVFPHADETRIQQLEYEVMHKMHRVQAERLLRLMFVRMLP